MRAIVCSIQTKEFRFKRIIGIRRISMYFISKNSKLTIHRVKTDIQATTFNPGVKCQTYATFLNEHVAISMIISAYGPSSHKFPTIFSLMFFPRVYYSPQFSSFFTWRYDNTMRHWERAAHVTFKLS